ncbi:hypothetical protein VTO73DRAFT_2426 [Trametes versicolor]
MEHASKEDSNPGADARYPASFVKALKRDLTVTIVGCFLEPPYRLLATPLTLPSTLTLRRRHGQWSHASGFTYRRVFVRCLNFLAPQMRPRYHLMDSSAHHSADIRYVLDVPSMLSLVSAPSDFCSGSYGSTGKTDAATRRNSTAPSRAIHRHVAEARASMTAWVVQRKIEAGLLEPSLVSGNVIKELIIPRQGSLILTKASLSIIMTMLIVLRLASNSFTLSGWHTSPRAHIHKSEQVDIEIPDTTGIRELFKHAITLCAKDPPPSLYDVSRVVVVVVVTTRYGLAFPAAEEVTAHSILTLHYKSGKILRNAKSTLLWTMAALELEFARHSAIVCIEIVEGARLVPLRAGLGFSCAPCDLSTPCDASALRIVEGLLGLLRTTTTRSPATSMAKVANTMYTLSSYCMEDIGRAGSSHNCGRYFQLESRRVLRTAPSRWLSLAARSNNVTGAVFRSKIKRREPTQRLSVVAWRQVGRKV